MCTVLEDHTSEEDCDITGTSIGNLKACNVYNPQLVDTQVQNLKRDSDRVSLSGNSSVISLQPPWPCYLLSMSASWCSMLRVNARFP
jgi:hypothetical protein